MASRQPRAGAADGAGRPGRVEQDQLEATGRHEAAARQLTPTLEKREAEGAVAGNEPIATQRPKTDVVCKVIPDEGTKQ
eukprot:scaffold27777_cov129-Isochrysis_galbana.AAC.8